MSLIESARTELAAINFGEEDSAVLIGILEKIFSQWDSGGAVYAVAPILMRCIAGQPLSPLTGEDSEWYDPMGDGLYLQNRRGCGSVFKGRWNADGDHDPAIEPWCRDIDAADPWGPITFPYDPGDRTVKAPLFEIVFCPPGDGSPAP